MRACRPASERFGGATVIGLLGKEPAWWCQYGIGFAVGFLTYLVLVLFFTLRGRTEVLEQKVFIK